MKDVSNRLSSHRRRLLILGQCLMVLGLIISCKSMWITLEHVEDPARKTAYALLFLGIAVCLGASGVLRQTKKVVLGVAFAGLLAMYLLVYLFITDFAHRTFLRDVIVLLALVLYYFLIEEIDEIPGILYRYETVVTIVAVLSVACWLVFSVLKLVPPSHQAMTWWNGTDHYTPVAGFYGIYYEPQTLRVFGIRMIRNCGFFTEAPMASLHFTLAFLIHFLLRKKVSRIRIILLAAAILTTFSATGIVVSVLALVGKGLYLLFHSDSFQRFSPSRKKGIRILLILVGAALLAGCVFLLLDRAGGLSMRIRLQDLKGAFLAWLDKPLFGNGAYNFEAVKMHYPAARAANAGFSSTTALGTILADGGLMFGLLYIGSFVSCIVKAVRNREYHVLLFAVLVLCIFTVTIVPYDYIMLLLFLFFGAYRSGIYHKIKERM